MKIKLAGRYFRKELAEFFGQLNRAGKTSRQKTKTERVLGFIRYSLDKDFREGFQPREHGQDAFQITERELAALLPTEADEKREQEAEYLRQSIEAASEFIRKAENRLSELSGSSGSLVFLRRKAEIREAALRAERRAV